jgi:SAM-dependent methyltransferase
MEPKPRHLGPEYAAQFGDASVTAAYATRPPYPEEVFDALASLLPPGPRRVLELGCGTGDLTLRLAPRVDGIDALDPSAAMLEIGRARARGLTANVRWLHVAAENFEPREKYALVVAAESLHWMEWSVVVPMIARALDERAVLAIVVARHFEGFAFSAQVRELIARHSTNRDFRPYDVVEELRRRGLFREIARRECIEPRFAQSVDDYVESFHSRNGFSRERMTAGSAAAFDAALRELVSARAPDGLVTGPVTSTVVWGCPLERQGT